VQEKHRFCTDFLFYKYYWVCSIFKNTNIDRQAEGRKEGRKYGWKEGRQAVCVSVSPSIPLIYIYIYIYIYVCIYIYMYVYIYIYIFKHLSVVPYSFCGSGPMALFGPAAVSNVIPMTGNW